MAWVVLDVHKGDPSFTQKLTLGGVDYVFTFAWNMRSGWYMGLAQGSTVLFQPRRLCVEVDLLEQYRYLEACPPGLLVAYDTSGNMEDPGYEDLRGLVNGRRQGRVILAYNDGT